MDLLILGASARAAAHSALRAGLRPAAIDLFADRDLAAIAPVLRIDRCAYPDGLAALAREAPPGPWMYTGALENHPDLVDTIARTRPLWGSAGEALRAARDPFHLAEILAHAGLAAPAVRRDPAGLPRDGRWLIKPLQSAGGRRIRPWAEGAEPPGPNDYLQERVDGPSLAAVFVAGRGGSTLLGITEQWIGSVTPGTRDQFTYRGSLGPVSLPRESERWLARLGQVLATRLGLVGLFGIDFILKDGVPRPVEVNPRYTASVEVLELAGGRPSLADHARACDPSFYRSSAARPAGRRPPQGFVGKAILHAPGACRFPERSPVIRPGRRPRVADLPAPGTRFEAGEPVLTVLAYAPDLASCQARLRARLADWRGRLI
jgi:predicted ATP-grasp superfamily ATP-dependent carboligase